MRVVIAGGGTGGHLYPGIAVARELMARDGGAQVTFVGTASGIESRVLPREGLALDLIRSGGLKGKSIADRVRGLWLLPQSLVDAWRVVSKRRPQLVIGVGGYSSGPVVLVAALRGVATMVLEQNAVPGLTNRLLAPFVRAAAVTYDSTRSFFGSKAVVSGNPVRPEFFASAGPSTEEAGADGDPQLEPSLNTGYRRAEVRWTRGCGGAKSALASATPRRDGSLIASNIEQRFVRIDPANAAECFAEASALGTDAPPAVAEAGRVAGARGAGGGGLGVFVVGVWVGCAMPPALTRLRERRFHRENPGTCRRHSSRQSYPNQS